MRILRRALASVVLITCCASGCSGTANHGHEPERLRVEVLETLGHDPAAFTQGLELAGGILYEGTGLSGRSSVSYGDIGAPPTSVAKLPSPLFGEGITVTDSGVWQLTWQDGIAFERDPVTLAVRRTVNYSGEGWGLCQQQDTNKLVMSDGSDKLTFRDPDNFAELGSVRVTEQGDQVDQLNELECVGDSVYANVWKSDDIVRIDPNTGSVTARIDASGLLGDAELGHADVLNGIAAVPGTDQFLLTGKFWPRMFRVKLVPEA